jgi:hypothetical protein
MNRLVALLLCAAMTGILGCAQALLVPSAPPGSEYYAGFTEGVQAAETRSDDVLWGAAAFLLGVPTGVAVALYGGNADANPPALMLIGKSEEYIRGFAAGFEGRVQQKRQQAGFTGLGVAAVATVLVALVYVLGYAGMY